MQRLIAFVQPGGGVSVVIPAPDGRLALSVRVGGERVDFEPPGIQIDQIKLAAKNQGQEFEILEFEPEADWLARVAAGSVPEGVAYQVIDADALPAGREFRNAWTIKDGRVAVDMPRARDIYRQRLREARAPRLAALDVEYQRADEAGDLAAKAAVAARKKLLRDLTADPAIEAAATPEALKAAWPKELTS